MFFKKCYSFFLTAPKSGRLVGYWLKTADLKIENKLGAKEGKRHSRNKFINQEEEECLDRLRNVDKKMIEMEKMFKQMMSDLQQERDKCKSDLEIVRALTVDRPRLQEVVRSDNQQSFIPDPLQATMPAPKDYRIPNIADVQGAEAAEVMQGGDDIQTVTVEQGDDDIQIVVEEVSEDISSPETKRFKDDSSRPIKMKLKEESRQQSQQFATSTGTFQMVPITAVHSQGPPRMTPPFPNQPSRFGVIPSMFQSPPLRPTTPSPSVSTPHQLNPAAQGISEDIERIIPPKRIPKTRLPFVPPDARNPKNFYCDDCGANYSRKNELSDHLCDYTKHHWKCNKCEKNFCEERRCGGTLPYISQWGI